MPDDVQYYHDHHHHHHHHQLDYAPINVKPAGGGGGRGWGFDICQKFAVKFPAHWQIIPVKYNQICPPRAAHCYQISQGRTQERHNENISK